jgi:hypothetical protein
MSTIYSVTLTGWGHTSTLNIEARDEAEAIQKAKALRGISVKVAEAAVVEWDEDGWAAREAQWPYAHRRSDDRR